MKGKLSEKREEIHELKGKIKALEEKLHDSAEKFASLARENARNDNGAGDNTTTLKKNLEDISEKLKLEKKRRIQAESVNMVRCLILDIP